MGLSTAILISKATEAIKDNVHLADPSEDSVNALCFCELIYHNKTTQMKTKPSKQEQLGIFTQLKGSRKSLTDTRSSLLVSVSLGIFYTAAIVGPAAGYLLGGYFLNIYTEIHMM